MNEESLFHQALHQPDAAARVAFLDQACASQPELRARIEKLLQAHDAPASLFDKPALDATSDVAPGQWIDPSALPETPLEGVGSRIGPYKLLQQIGEGGMGVVFMAEQQEPVRRMVALKVIKAGMDSAQVIARFEAERQALALMDHPNIAKVFDAGKTQSGRPYFVMELVKGIPITRYCDEQRLSPKQRLELFMPVCQAIQHAHQKGIIHRDIKPSNVLIAAYDGKPVPKVIDFGVAKATGGKLTERTLFTGFGNLVGTLEYMSPEQAEFNALDIDTRSDIYSLGVLLYELLTGTTPLTRQRLKKAAIVEVLRLIREEEPPRPSTRLSESKDSLASVSAQRHMEPAGLVKAVRGEVDWIVMKALEKDRTRRYETANAFAMDLQRYLADEPVQACPPSAIYRFRKFIRRNKSSVLAATLLMLALLGGIIGTTWGMLRARDAEGVAVNETQQKEQALEEKSTALQTAQNNYREAKKQETLANDNAKIAQAQELLARHRLYAAQMNLAMQAWEAGDSARTLELLETQRPKFDQDDLRGFEWYYLWRLCHGGLRVRLKRLPGTVHSIAFFPDGKTLASSANFDSTVNFDAIKLWDVATAQEKSSWQSSAWALTISPDGKTLGSWGYKDPVRLWDSVSGKQLAVFSGADSCTFSPDGKTIAVTRGADVEFWDAAGRRRQSVLHIKQRHRQRGSFNGDTFLFSPDGKTALAGVTGSLVRIYRRDGGSWQEGTEISGHGWFLPTAFSPDGKTFAVGGDVLKLYATETGKELRTLAGHTGTAHSVAFSPDGKSLASGGGDRTVRVWDVATGKQRTSYPHPARVYSVAYSPDGSILASSGPNGMLRLWDSAPAEEATVLRHPHGFPSGVAFFPDGKTLAASGPAPKLWDLATGQESATLGSAGGPLALSQDGKSLAIGRGADVELWDMTSRKPYAVLKGHSNGIFSVAFSPDGKTVATGSYDMTARLWDIATRQARVTLKPKIAVSAVAFSPDGRTLATAYQPGQVELWDTRTGKKVRVVPEHDREGSGGWTWSVAFSPDGKMLAVASQTGIVRVWDPASGQLLASLRGHAACVYCLAFSPDGKTLATASADGTARLWDTATGQEKVTLKSQAGAVAALAFARDGNTLATASDNGTVKLWRAATDQAALARKTELEPDEPGNVFDLLDQAGRLMASGQLKEAEETNRRARLRLEKLAAVFPNDADYKSRLAQCQFNLAHLLEVKGQQEEADKAYRTTLELAPPSELASLHRSLARMEATAGRWDEAVRQYSKTLELHDSDWIWWHDRGCAYMELNQPDKALSDFTRSLALHTEEAWVWNMRGVAYSRLGKYDAAIADFSKVIELDPNQKLAWPNRGYVEAQVGRWKEAAADFAKAVELQDAEIEPLYFHALTCLQAGDQGAYGKICAVMFERFGTADEPLTASRLAWTCVLGPKAAADPTRLVQVAERMVAKDANDPAYRTALGAALYRAGRFPEAVRQLAEATTFKPDPKTSPRYTWFFLAMAHHRQGNTDEARRWLAKAVHGLDSELADAAPWNRRLTLQLLRREAEELVEDKKKEDRK